MFFIDLAHNDGRRLGLVLTESEFRTLLGFSWAAKSRNGADCLECPAGFYVYEYKEERLCK